MENLPLSLLDIAVLVVILVSGGFSFMRGLLHEVLSIGAWVGAGFATLYGFHPLLPHVSQFINIPIVAEIATGTVIFVVVLGLLSALIRFFCKHVRESTFGPLDKTLGFLFGLVRGAIIVCIAWVFIFVFLIPESSGWPNDVQKSKTRPLLVQGSAMLIELIPEEFRNAVMIEALNNARKARAAYDATRAYEQLLAPSPESPSETQPANSSGETGYDQQSRDDLQKAIENLNTTE
ncbi:CvpA family protein [Kiloniella sp. b19]|uniref:CvpA family protein n=1 Tax=Kiloniella sp. GXU_MW_B19 TaxID=3141326 RepID=UPI0031E0B943